MNSINGLKRYAVNTGAGDGRKLRRSWQGARWRTLDQHRSPGGIRRHDVTTTGQTRSRRSGYRHAWILGSSAGNAVRVVVAVIRRCPPQMATRIAVALNGRATRQAGWATPCLPSPTPPRAALLHVDQGPQVVRARPCAEPSSLSTAAGSFLGRLRRLSAGPGLRQGRPRHFTPCPPRATLPFVDHRTGSCQIIRTAPPARANDLPLNFASWHGSYPVPNCRRGRHRS